MKIEKESEGLGDTIAKVINKLGLDSLVEENCLPCEERRKALNKLVPYNTPTPNGSNIYNPDLEEYCHRNLRVNKKLLLSNLDGVAQEFQSGDVITNICNWKINLDLLEIYINNVKILEWI